MRTGGTGRRRMSSQENITVLNLLLVLSTWKGFEKKEHMSLVSNPILGQTLLHLSQFWQNCSDSLEVFPAIQPKSGPLLF